MLGGTVVEEHWQHRGQLSLVFVLIFNIVVYIPAGAARSETHEGLLAYVNGEYEDASHLLAWQAERGDVDAQFLMGRICELGLAGVVDDHAAAVWYLRAAQGGDPAAQLSIGMMYAEGRGLAWDFLEAYVWLSRAMVGLPAGAGREEAAEIRRAVRTVLRPADLHRAAARLMLVVG